MNLSSIIAIFLTIGAEALSELNDSNPSVGETIDLLIEDDARINSDRNPRKLFNKIHKGAAFAAGVKLGHYLAGKGLGLGSGSLATSHSFTLFGKSFSTALSLSYADNIAPLPLNDVMETPSAPERTVDNILHIAVLENPSKETLDRLRAVARISEDKRNETEIPANNSFTSIVKTPRQPTFIQEHNMRVEDINRKMFANRTRINSRF